MISVGNKDLWSTAGLMLLAYACHATAMCMLRMHSLDVTHALFYAIDALHNQPYLGAWKNMFHFAKTVIGMGMVARLQDIKGRQSTATQAAHLLQSFRESGPFSWSFLLWQILTVNRAWA